MKDKEDLILLLIFMILGLLAVMAIVVGEKLEEQQRYKLDYEIETYIDDEGIVYKILRDSNGDTVFVDKRYE